MEIEVQLTNLAIADRIPPPAIGGSGAWLEFRGVVRGEEAGQGIAALEYEAYPEMAGREIRRLLEALAAEHPCLAARVIHRLGAIPVGETAIYVGVSGRHRAEAIALLARFMDRLKKDVPIWKRRAVPVSKSECGSAGGSLSAAQPINQIAAGHRPALRSLDEAIQEITSSCQPLPAVRVSLEESVGRALRETVCAAEDWPVNDRSTRDGYAIRSDDSSVTFQIVDTIHAADWKPRQLQPGETVRVATGAVLPCEGLRVVMQECVERNGDGILIMKREASLNIRKRGEEVKAGQPLVRQGERLDAGKLALLATAGCAEPMVSPRLRVVHITTGDEIVLPRQTPKPGQVRDSNSILIRGLLQHWPNDLFHTHLPEDFEKAKLEIRNLKSEIEAADLLLISGGASVGDGDFTGPLLEWLGFEIVFSQVNVRPGKPLIFGVNGSRVAFGLPGNPLSHFVCFHFAVATALARMSGEAAPKSCRGRLASRLDDVACPRESLWPARLDWNEGTPHLHPLAWASSGDVSCLAAANALIRVPARLNSLEAGAELDFLPVAVKLGA